MNTMEMKISFRIYKIHRKTSLTKLYLITYSLNYLPQALYKYILYTISSCIRSCGLRSRHNFNFNKYKFKNYDCDMVQNL